MSAQVIFCFVSEDKSNTAMKIAIPSAVFLKFDEIYVQSCQINKWILTPLIFTIFTNWVNEILRIEYSISEM